MPQTTNNRKASLVQYNMPSQRQQRPKTKVPSVVRLGSSRQSRKPSRTPSLGRARSATPRPRQASHHVAKPHHSGREPAARALSSLTARANQGVKDIVRTVMLPSAYNARFPTGLRAQETALAAPWSITGVDVTSEPPSTDLENVKYLPGGGYFVAISRNPLCSKLEYLPNFNFVPFQYDFMFTTTTSNSIENYPTVNKNCFYPDDQFEMDWLPISAADSNSTWQPHGKRLYAQYDQTPTIRGLWIDGSNDGNATPAKATSVQFQYLDSGLTPFNTTTGQLEVYTYDGMGWTNIYQTNWNLGAIPQITVTRSGYYAFKMEITKGHQTGLPSYITASFQGTCPVLAHTPLPGIVNRELTIPDLRINGTSIMVTPDSTELAKGGRLTAVQLDPGLMAENFFVGMVEDSTDPATALQNLDGQESRGFDNGYYGFMKPASAEDYEMVQPFRYNAAYGTRAGALTTDSSTVCAFSSPLKPPGGWLCVGVMVAPTYAGSKPYAGGLCHTTHNLSLEYVSPDPWYMRAQTTTSNSQMQAAFELVSRAPQHFDNSFHWTDITRWLGKAWDKVNSILPEVAAVASALIPEATPLIGGLTVAAREAHKLAR
jgi:hypothetical protein